jgi:hypothetical protein
MKSNRFFCFLIVCLLSYSSLAQNVAGWNYEPDKNCLPDSIRSTAVIYNSAYNGLPDSIHVKGKALSVCQGLCGTFCGGGTMEVQLSEKIQGYPYSVIYLVTACGFPKCDVMVDLHASKLLKTDTECYYQSIANCYDTKGIPFYKLSEAETAQIR